MNCKKIAERTGLTEEQCQNVVTNLRDEYPEVFLDMDYVRRLEIVSMAGRLLVLKGIAVTLSLQDEQRTLKIFVNEHP
jgi:hypothetical protein